MTLRTDHATTITPELGALAELIFLVEQLLEERDDGAAFVALSESLERGKVLVEHRLRARIASCHRGPDTQLPITGFWTVE